MKFSRTIVKNYVDIIKVYNENGELRTDNMPQEQIITTKELTLEEATKIVKKLYPEENVMVMRVSYLTQKRVMDLKTFIANSTVIGEKEGNCNESNESVN